MPISTEHVKLLESYRDKAYITSILCAQSSEHFSFLRSMVNLPLIISSSVMTVLNSMSDNSNEMKYANIVLNTWTSLILSIIGNFKLTEQATNFKQIDIKMNKLTHKIEDFLSIDLENTKIEDIRAIINKYDTLNESLDFPFPNFIKNRVKKIYSGKKTLPNILNCEISFVKVDESINDV
jgi:Na+/H+-translocating membrane pyrophosphatase